MSQLEKTCGNMVDRLYFCLLISFIAFELICEMEISLVIAVCFDLQL